MIYDPRDDRIKELEQKVAELQEQLRQEAGLSAWQMGRIHDLEQELEVRTSQVCACQLAERLSRLEERFEYVCRENGFWDGT